MRWLWRPGRHPKAKQRNLRSKKEAIRLLLLKQFSAEDIADALQETVEFVQKIRAEIIQERKLIKLSSSKKHRGPFQLCD